MIRRMRSLPDWLVVMIAANLVTTGLILLT